MATISVHYWAGAKAAAGVEVERFEAPSVAAALQAARESRQDARFDRVLMVSSILVDGLVAGPDALGRDVTGMVSVEVLPPFAGGGLP